MLPTDHCVHSYPLSLHRWIDWSQFLVIVPERHISRLGFILRSISPARVRQMQKNVRLAWRYMAYDEKIIFY